MIAGKGDFPDMEDLGDVDSEDRNSAIVIDSGAFNYTGAMFRVDLDTGKAKTIFKSSGMVPAGLAVADKDTAYVTRVFPLSLYEVDLKTGDLTLSTARASTTRWASISLPESLTAVNAP